MNSHLGRTGRVEITVVVLVLVLALAVGGESAVAQGATGPEAGRTADPDEARLTGRVFEAGGQGPVVRAHVRLFQGGDPGRDPDGHRAVLRETWTDQEGRYAFEGLPAGRYELRFERVGYRPVGLGVELPASGSLERSAGLPIEPLGLEEVRVRGAAVPFTSRLAWRPSVRQGTGGEAVRGERRPGPPTLDARSLGHRQIESLSTLGEPDVFRALQRTPGVSSRGDYSADLWVRSAPWGMTRVLLDGFPLHDPLHLGGSVAGVASDALADATLLPGVRPVRVASGAAATVQLRTRPAGPQSMRTVAISPLAIRGTLEERLLADRVGLAVTARRSWWDWVAPPQVYAGGGSGGPIDYHMGDLSARADARLPAGLQIEGAGLYQVDELDGEVAGIVASSRARWGNRLGWVSLARNADPADSRAWSTRLTVGRSGHHSWTRSRPWSSFLSPDGTPSLAWTTLDLTHAAVRFAAEGRLPDHPIHWASGLEWMRESLEQTGIEASDRDAPGVDRPAQLEWWRGWGELGVRTDHIDGSVGIAYDHAPGAGAPDMGALAHLRLRVRPNERFTVELARGGSRQTAYPLARSGGTVGPSLGVGHVWMLAGPMVPTLDSETATLSSEIHLPGDLGLATTLWTRTISGMLMNGAMTIDEGSLTRPVAHGQTGTEAGRGWEASLYRHAGRVTGGVSYSRGRSEIRGSDTAIWASPAERRHSVNAALDLAIGRGWGVTALYTWESGWPYAVGPWECEEIDGCEIPFGDPLRPTSHSFERAPAYRSLDLRTSWMRQGKHADWEVALSLRNALGWGNVQAWRPLGCRGRAELSTVCSQAVGVGEFAPGPSGPTPALSFQLRF